MAENVAVKICKLDLEADLQAKFDAAMGRLSKLDAAPDADTKAALKGMLQLMATYRDKMKPPQLHALAQLVGFVGEQAAGNGASTADTSDDAAEEDMPDDAPAADDPFGLTAAADPTGKGTEGAADDKDPQLGKRDSTSKRGTQVNPELEAFRKAAAKENEELRKAQDELRKQNEAIKAQLRKKELAEEVLKKYPALGANQVMTERVMELDRQGLLKSWEPQLVAWNEQLSKGALFGEMGAGGEGGQDLSLEQQLAAKAQDIMKADPSLKYEQAYTRAYEQNPDIRTAMQKRDRAARR